MKYLKRNFRVYTVFSFFFFIFLCILFKITYLQVFAKEFFKSLADSQYVTVISFEGDRGIIYDREGRILAKSINTYSVYADPELIDDKNKVTEHLSEILEVDKDILKEKLSLPRRFVWIKRKIPWKDKEKLANLDLEGVGFIRGKKRFYTQNTIGSHILGSVNIDNRGIEGLELFYDSYLRGKQGGVSILRDSSASKLVFSPQTFHPQPGANISLTIDAQIQYWAEFFLKETIEKFSAKAGSVVIIDSFTGEVLALANYPVFDPNRMGEFPFDLRRNRAITDMFEPGSVFKIVTLMAAIAKKEFSDEDIIFCENGRYKIPGTTLHDWKPYGSLSFKEVFKKSSNIGVAKISNKLGNDFFYQYIKKLGFGNKTNIDLPGEIKGSLKPLSEWSSTSHYIIPIGQEIGVNLVQLACAMAVIANGGNLVRPYLMKKIWRDGFLLEAEVVKKRVLPLWASKKAKSILLEVVEEGTGKRARIENAKVGGKTGTAQKFDLKSHRYSPTKYRASFIGFVERGEISFVIAVSVDEPSKSHFGGVVAAPLFKKIGEESLRYLEYKNILTKNALEGSGPS